MVKISAAEVNKLRKTTGAGMMDCKKALVEAEGDFEKAIDVLRKKGQKVAAKRADRDSAEGAVIVKANSANTFGVLVSLNCETDFVAKNDTFVQLAHSIAELAANGEFATKEELLAADLNGMSVEEKLTEQTGVIGEKIEIGAYKTITGGYVNGYIHAGNKIASLVALSANVDGAEDATKNVAMQVAAMSPVALNKDSVTQETIDRELEVAKDLAIQEGKPAEMADKIAQGRLNKFFKEATLVAQEYIKSEKKETVEAYIKSIDKDLVVSGFVRHGLG